jgi:hypothetical protein
MQNKKLGRYLGPNRSVGDIMCMQVLTLNSTLRSITSDFPLSVQDKNSGVVKKQMTKFEYRLAEKLSDRAAGLAPEEEGMPEMRIGLETTEPAPYDGQMVYRRQMKSTIMLIISTYRQEFIFQILWV